MTDLIVGDIIEGIVADFGSDGEGIVKFGGIPVFVPYAIKGEKVRVRVNYVKKDCAFGELVEVINPSEDRTKPLCPYFGECGGCDMQHMSTPLQLSCKRDCVKVALKKFGNIDIEVPVPVRLNNWEYRNKLSLPFAYNSRSRRISLGFYQKKSHRVVPIKYCPLHGQWAADLIKIVTEWANEFAVSVYSEDTKRGLLRHLVARKLDAMSVTFVINGNRLPHCEELIRRLKLRFEKFTLYISENTKADNVILRDVKLIYGREEKQNLGQFYAKVSPKSFLQVNSDVRDALYDEAAKALCDFDGDIIELYSGVGLLTAQIARRLPNASVTAVEIEKSSHSDAIELMSSLGISDRVENICDDAAHFLANLPERKNADKLDDLDESIRNSPYYLGNIIDGQPSERALILDPPRKGCDGNLLRIADFERIVYISCNPQTLARDLKILSDKYELADIKLFDMFPQTANVETLAVLKRK